MIDMYNDNTIKKFLIDDYENLQNNIKEYANLQKNNKLIVFDLKDFANTFNYELNTLKNMINQIKDDNETILKNLYDKIRKYTKKPLIIEGLNEYTIYKEVINSTEKYYKTNELDELKYKYKTLKKAFRDIEQSSNKHTVKEELKTYLTIEYTNKEYNIFIQDIIKLTDIETTGAGQSTYPIKETEKDKILVFSFKEAEKIKDIFLNREYYSIKDILTYRHYTPKTLKEYKDDSLFSILEYLSTDATKRIKKDHNLRYKILDLLNNIIYKNKLTSSVLTLKEYKNKIIFPEVIKSPEMHEYNTIPTPEEIFKELARIKLNDKTKTSLLNELTKLNKDHNILTMAYFIGTLLIPIINYETTPYLILYGEAEGGKTKTANLFNFFTVQSDRTTTTQIMRTAQGYGCGYFVLDEPKTLNNDVIQLLKDLATKKKYVKTYGKTGQKYIFKTGGIISANNIYEIKTKNPDDLNAFFRRNIVIKINENDKIQNISNTIRKLEGKNKELKNIFIEYLTGQDPQELINKYESINTDEEQYKFIIFSLEMLKELFNKYGIEVLTDTRIKEIINRLKETEKEFQQDILKDDNIITMIEQIIYNDLLKIATLKDREPEKLNELDTLNKYSEILYKQHGYTIYYMKDKKRIAINKTGQQKLIKILNKEYGTNYPEQTTQKYLMDKLTEKAIYAKIKQARISNNKNATQPRCLFIEIPYNYDLAEYKDIINIIIAISGIYEGKIDTNEVKEHAKKKGIKEIQINECINALKHYEIIKEIEREIYEVNIKELEKATETQENEPEQQDTPAEKPKNNTEKVINTIRTLKNIFGNDLIDFESIKEQIQDMTEEEIQDELDKLKYIGDIDQPRPNKYRII